VEEPKHIEIDPRRAFGRPVVAGTSVPTESLAERFRAGDSLEELAHDFRIATSVVESALRWEMSAAAADPPAFFVDHCLGTEVVAERLRREGATVHVLVESGFDEATTDEACFR